jgi:hypothetical protein
MARLFFVLFLVAGTISLHAGSRIFYLSARPGAGGGTGTPADPVDVSTAAKFDDFFADRSFMEGGVENNHTQFHFLPGNYCTATGIRPVSGWELIGAGPDRTTITFTAKTNVANTGYGSAVIATNRSLHDVSVRDLTIDGGTLATGAPVLARFQTPAQGKSVPVRVADTRLFTPGARVYVQDTATVGGVRTFFGEFKIAATRPGIVTLLNDGLGSAAGAGGLAPIGSTVPATARVFLLLYARAGIVLASHNIHLENVTVQDVSVPAYESPVGFDIFENPGEIGSGNVIDRCRLRDVFGCYGWGIGVVQNNPYPSWKYHGQCDITHCVLDGNGYFQGIDFIEVEKSTVANNIVRNFPIAFFSDSGNCAHLRFAQNIFIGPAGVAGGGFKLAGGFPWFDCLITDNTLVSSAAGGPGIYILSPIYNCIFQHNRIEGTGHDSVVFSCSGKNNQFINNIIDSRFTGQTVKSPTLGIDKGNTTPDHRPVSIGFKRIGSV